VFVGDNGFPETDLRFDHKHKFQPS